MVVRRRAGKRLRRQRDPGGEIIGFGDCRFKQLDDLAHVFGKERADQMLLVRPVAVERGFAAAGLASDLADAGGVDALGHKEFKSRELDRFACAWRTGHGIGS